MPTSRLACDCSALALALALAAVSTGCNSNAQTTSPLGGSDAGDDAAFFSCANETRAVPYTANFTRTTADAKFSAVITDAQPAPWVKGNNTWTVELQDGSGAPLDGLDVKAKTFMPDHGHPSTVPATVTPNGGGTYTVTPLYLYMDGFWQVTLTFTSPTDATPESILFPVCVDG